MEPLLIDVSPFIGTERLILRCPLPGDGPMLNAAVCESIAELRPWLPWAQTPPSLDASEAQCRRMHARFVLREDLVWFVFDSDAAGAEGRLLGGCGLHRMDWTLRRFEIGYWRRSGCDGRGVMTEAVRALSRIAFDRLAARRVEIHMDARNERSRRLAERAGFAFEGLLRHDSLAPDGELRSTRIHARVRGIEEPMACTPARG